MDQGGTRQLPRRDARGLGACPGLSAASLQRRKYGQVRDPVARGKYPTQRVDEAGQPILIRLRRSVSGTNEKEIANQVCDLLDMRAGKRVLPGDELVFGRERKRGGRGPDGAIGKLTGAPGPAPAN